MSAPVIIPNRDLDFITPAPLAVNTGAVADIVLLRTKGLKGILRIDGTVGAGGALAGLLIAAAAVQDTTPQTIANSAATPQSDFASPSYRKPGNSPSPDSTAASGMFWVDLLIDGCSDIVIRAAGAAATTLLIKAHATERGRIG